ncbi:MAG: hypothetical protein IKY83_01490 [Proteobacteria bacterium]|nr:hypothetical protein [Pseudomonadota bacterium]
MRGVIGAICLSLLCSSVAFAAPNKEKPKKGNPADQAVLDLVAPFVDDSNTKADGDITDWGNYKLTEFSTLMSGEYDYDWTGPKDLSGGVTAMYGAEKIYFYIKVKDNAVVSKKKQWKSDKVELWLASEDAAGKPLGGIRGLQLDLGPIVDGNKLSAKWLSGKQSGAEAVGYVGDGGYDIEISVDYTALGKTPVMNGAVRYCVLVRDWDQDDANEDEAAVGSCPINPKSPGSIKREKMGKIALNLKDAMWQYIVDVDRNHSLGSEKRLSSAKAPWQTEVADIGGTATPDLIAFSGDTLVIAGYGLGSDKLAWYTLKLESEGTNAPAKIQISDINGDKKPEIVITRDEPCANNAMTASRSYIFRFERNATHYLASYINEVRMNDGSQVMRNTYKFTKNATIQTLDPKSAKDMGYCQLSGSSDMFEFLMPSDGLKTRVQPNITSN